MDAIPLFAPADMMGLVSLLLQQNYFQLALQRGELLQPQVHNWFDNPHLMQDERSFSIGKKRAAFAFPPSRILVGHIWLECQPLIQAKIIIHELLHEKDYRLKIVMRPLGGQILTSRESTKRFGFDSPRAYGALLNVLNSLAEGWVDSTLYALLPEAMALNVDEWVTTTNRWLQMRATEEPTDSTCAYVLLNTTTSIVWFNMVGTAARQQGHLASATACEAMVEKLTIFCGQRCAVFIKNCQLDEILSTLTHNFEKKTHDAAVAKLLYRVFGITLIPPKE